MKHLLSTKVIKERYFCDLLIHNRLCFFKPETSLFTNIFYSPSLFIFIAFFFLISTPNRLRAFIF
jgi:hypothetical protein